MPFLYIYKREINAESSGVYRHNNLSNIMARFIITTKHTRSSNGIRIEPGMQVEVVTQSMSNPVSTNGGKAVIDAFYRIYGIDIKKAGCLNMVELDVRQV